MNNVLNFNSFLKFLSKNKAYIGNRCFRIIYFANVCYPDHCLYRAGTSNRSVS